jgi:hypothetical protein
MARDNSILRTQNDGALLRVSSMGCPSQVPLLLRGFPTLVAIRQRNLHEPSQPPAGGAVSLAGDESRMQPCQALFSRQRAPRLVG